MAYNLPKSAIIGKFLPKNLFFAKGELDYKTRDLFSKYIQKITWEYKIDKDSVGIPKGEKVEGIALFKIILKERDVPDKILGIINKLVPYPILYECEFGKDSRYIIKHEKEYLKSEWNQNIDFDFNGINLDNVYYQIVLKIILDNYACKMGRSDRFDDIVDWYRKVEDLKKEIEKLEVKIKQEIQFNHKVELNRQLQAKKLELKKLLSQNFDE